MVPILFPKLKEWFERKFAGPLKPLIDLLSQPTRPLPPTQSQLLFQLDHLQATQAVHAMDKFVVFVVLMVLSNHMVLFANAVHPRARFLFLHPIVAANTNSVQFVEEGSVKASKPQVLAQQAAAPIPTDQATNFKLQFVDSIFQVRTTRPLSRFDSI